MEKVAKEKIREHIRIKTLINQNNNISRTEFE